MLPCIQNLNWLDYYIYIYIYVIIDMSNQIEITCAIIMVQYPISNLVN